MRRSEIIGLRGGQVKILKGALRVKNLVKGGDYVERELEEPLLLEALLDYLKAAERSQVFKTNAPLWTRHDRAGKPGAPLSSHAFAHNLKQYARQADIEHIHIHQTRHTFARIVAEESGSMTETQDALGHRNLATTRVYVQRVAVKRDKSSRKVMQRLSKPKNT
jgi:integrase